MLQNGNFIGNSNFDSLPYRNYLYAGYVGFWVLGLGCRAKHNGESNGRQNGK